MRRTDNPQVNTKVYWDYVYTNPERAKEYRSMTSRFSTALEYVKDNDRFLDIGCGVGVLTRMVKAKRTGCEIWGVDISHEVIKSNLLDDPDIKYSNGMVGALTSLPEEYFDVIFCGETIEHLDRPEDLFEDAYRLLKRDGLLIITTPQEERIPSPEHTWFFMKDDINTLFMEAGFERPVFRDLPDLEHMVVFFAVGRKL